MDAETFELAEILNRFIHAPGVDQSAASISKSILGIAAVDHDFGF